MQEQKIKKKNIYMDKMSGQDFARPQYLKLLKKLKKGDVIFIKSIDRLGRNYEEILEQWRVITKEIGADIQVIDMPLLNTNSSRDNLTGVFIADLVLQILAYVAETERAFIKQRQAEYFKMWSEGKISLRKAAVALQMNYTTFYRRCKEYREKKMENCSRL